jgi:protocatechuate 3,4-dioxygenase beta subunit
VGQAILSPAGRQAKDLRYIAVFLLLAACAHAATVQGAIYDEETRNPLARTKVSLIPLPGTPSGTATMLANERGAYAFQGVVPGWYLIRTARPGYAIAEYGQARPGLPGTPIEVSDTGQPESRQIVMRRQAAITGSVLDDNAVGIADWPVSVYTARQPITRIAQGTTDDRGNFRIGELDPGAYIVRSGGGELEDASTLVPAYFKYGTAVANAESVRVRLGETQGYVVIHTVEGKLFELTGDVTPNDRRPAMVTLITDTGRRTIASKSGPYVAPGVPPGPIELLAEGQGCASYQKLLVDRNMFARVDCSPLVPPVITGAGDVPLIARRRDLDGPGPETTVSADKPLLPGHWEFTLQPGPSYYLVSIANEEDKTPPARLDGWFPLDIGNAPRLRVTLSAKPASISGVVSSSSRPVIGAPVFLQQLNPDAPELPLQSWSGRADAQGSFSFTGLAPGSYRLMSSFDVDFDDPLARDKSAALTLNEGEAVTQPLEMIRQ